MMGFYKWVTTPSSGCPVWVAVASALVMTFFGVIYIVLWVIFLCEGYWAVSLLLFPVAPMITIALAYRHKLENEKIGNSDER